MRELEENAILDCDRRHGGSLSGTETTTLVQKIIHSRKGSLWNDDPTGVGNHSGLFAVVRKPEEERREQGRLRAL